MSRAALAGGLRVAARWMDGELRDWQVRLERPPVAQALVGLAPADALARLPLFYSLCGEAQREAGRLALAAAGCPLGATPAPWRLWAECLHEQLWRLLLDWPRALGQPPQTAAFATWRAARALGREALAAATAELAAGVIHAPQARPGNISLAAPIAAFDAAARALADDLDYPAGSHGSAVEGWGEARVHTARGPLRHVVHLVDGRVAAWQVEAPTDRNFVDEKRIVENLPSSLPTPETARRALERAVLLLNPCVPYSVEIVDA